MDAARNGPWIKHYWGCFHGLKMCLVVFLAQELSPKSNQNFQNFPDFICEIKKLFPPFDGKAPETFEIFSLVFHSSRAPANREIKPLPKCVRASFARPFFDFSRSRRGRSLKHQVQVGYRDGESSFVSVFCLRMGILLGSALGRKVSWEAVLLKTCFESSWDLPCLDNENFSLAEL